MMIGTNQHKNGMNLFIQIIFISHSSFDSLHVQPPLLLQTFIWVPMTSSYGDSVIQASEWHKTF